MKNKIYHLSTCSTCVKILAQIEDKSGIELINIKENNISEADLDYAAKALGSYEAVFSKKAMKYRSLKLNERTLTEPEYKKYILEEYTFLKRPVSIINGQVFAGNTKDSVAQLVNACKNG